MEERRWPFEASHEPTDWFCLTSCLPHLSLMPEQVSLDSCLCIPSISYHIISYHHQVEQRIKDGPRRDLDAYLAAVDKLKDAIAYFNEHPTYTAAEGASLLSHNLMREAMAMLEADFRQLLANNRWVLMMRVQGTGTHVHSITHMHAQYQTIGGHWR